MGLDAGHQLVANLAVYFNKISGYQLTQNARNNLGNTTSATVNAGDAEIMEGARKSVGNRGAGPMIVQPNKNGHQFGSRFLKERSSFLIYIIM